MFAPSCGGSVPRTDITKKQLSLPLFELQIASVAHWAHLCPGSTIYMAE